MPLVAGVGSTAMSQLALAARSFDAQASEAILNSDAFVPVSVGGAQSSAAALPLLLTVNVELAPTVWETTLPKS